MLTEFMRPSKIQSLERWVVPWTIGLSLICFLVGLALGLFFSPPDYQQGETVRIMYIHVPASWWALGVYTIMAGASVTGFITKAPLCHLLTKAIAPIGLSFTLISLITGSLWGKPTWGTWWVWDARLTSMLILLFLYIGYQLLVTAFDDQEKGLAAGAVIAMVGWINVPLIKWSVDWWHTLHQPASIIRLAKPAIHWTMLVPLAFMAAAFTGYFLSLMILRLNLEINRRKSL